MTKLLVLYFFIASCAVSPAQEENSSAAASRDIICGTCAAWQNYREEGHVRRGLAVDMLVGPGLVNHPVTLRFFVSQKPSNWPEDDLEIEHEKYMHVIGIREDLQDFFHVHPTRTGPGMWSVNFTFTNGGNYKIWTDVRWQNTSYTFGHPVLRISGDPGPSREVHDFRNSVMASGYRVTLKHPEPLIEGRANLLQFSVQDPAGNAAEMENFLGSPVHLVMVKEDLSVYVHAHPDSALAGSAIVQFSPTFPTDGVYKLFAQFRPSQAKLLLGDSFCAEFYLMVERGP